MPSSVTIGNFDGVHIGHQRIFRRVAEIARANRWTPVVLTFDPQNRVTGRMTYVAGRDAAGRWPFEIHDETGGALPIPLRVAAED